MPKLARLVLATIVAMAVISAGTATAGAEKFPLLGPDGNAFCNGSGVISGTDLGFGFAVINAPADGTVMTTVSLKKLRPDTTYTVRLIQGNTDCFDFDGTITTNRVGNGNVHISEPATSSTAFVAVDTPGEMYVTETYVH